MASTIRIKRRSLGGASGAPTSLAQSELCYSEVDGILHIGVGTGGSSTVVAIGGPGAYLSTATAASTYAPKASPALTGVPTAPTASSGTNTTQLATTAFVTSAVAAVDVSGLLGDYLTKASAASTYLTTATASSTYLTSATAASTYATLASPSLTGVPLAPTATAGTNNTQIATTAFVGTAVSNLVASAPDALNTLNELAAALGNDASFSTTVTNSIGGKLAKASNLSDLVSASTARTNLGLGTMAVQNANNVNIAGGVIDGVTIDCGEFDAGVITISSQPSNQTASSGAATFSVTASVSPAGSVTYQWQRQALGTGSYSNVSGATSASLALTGLTNGSNNADNYRVVVSATGAPSVTSNAAVLTVAAAAALLSIARSNGSSSFAVSGANSSTFTRADGQSINSIDGVSKYTWTAGGAATVTLSFGFREPDGESASAVIRKKPSGGSFTTVHSFDNGTFNKTFTVSVVAGDVIDLQATLRDGDIVDMSVSAA